MNQPDFLKVSRKDLLSYMIGSPKISWPLWVVLAVGICVILIGFVSDRLMIYLGLIICFTFAPTIAFFLYFSNMIDSHIMINILPHTVESRHGGYMVRIYRPDFGKDHCNHHAEETDAEDDKDNEPQWVETGKMTVFESNVVKRSENSRFSILYLVNSPVKVLYIPKGMLPIPMSCDVHH